MHNDFVSGSRELAARGGITVCASSAGGLQFDHRPLQRGDAITLGEVQIKVLSTPGHTPEHISFLATDTSTTDPPALFSGGALLVGGVARTDLLGKQLAPFLGRWFFQAIRQELQPLADDVIVYPTHGGGSFCLATPAQGGALTSTIGLERATNPFFQARTEQEFLELALADLPSYPAYYKRMAGINRRGPRVLGQLPVLSPLSPREAWAWIQKEAEAIDTRAPTAFAGGHVPNAYAIPAGDSFGTWVGWVVAPGRPLLFVTEQPEGHDEMVRQLVRIGYDDLLGYVQGGMEGWGQAQLPVTTLKTMTEKELHQQWQGGDAPLMIDVRFLHEYQEDHIPATIHVELGELQEHADGLPRDARLATICAAGFRACTGASILRREGFSDVALVLGSTNAWREAGYPMEKVERIEAP